MRAIWRPPVCSFQSCFVRAGPPNTHCNRPLNLVPNSRHSDCVSSLDHKGFAANPAAADFFRSAAYKVIYSQTSKSVI